MKRLALYIAALAACAPAWAAPSLSLSQTVDPEIYARGRSIQVTVSIDAITDGESVLSLGFEQAIPTGWEFEEVIASSTPMQIVPPSGDTGLIEFAFSGAVSTFPQVLVYTLRTSFASSTPKDLLGTAIGVFSVSSVVEQEETITIEPDPDSAWLSADVDRDGVLELSELLRLVQLYNSANGIHCDDTTEDGFATGPGDRACNNHTSDYLDGNWTIALSELLRAVQIFRIGTYFPCDLGEDGYCTGAP